MPIITVIIPDEKIDHPVNINSYEKKIYFK